MRIDDAVYRILDLETTGVEVLEHEVVEIAHVDVQRVEGAWRVVRASQCLVCPGRSIPPEASAVHHLTDADVADAPSWQDVRAMAVKEWSCARPVVLVAHNAAFDMAFLNHGYEMWGGLVLCTMRLAQHIWPEAPGYSNQCLYYWRRIVNRVDGELAGDRLDWLRDQVGAAAWAELDTTRNRAHAALFDAVTTTLLAMTMLDAAKPGAEIETVIRYAESPIYLGERKIGFGKHGPDGGDRLWRDVPRDYLEWMQKEDRKCVERDGQHAWDVDQRFTIERLLGGRESEVQRG